jgi:cholesterol transport system auxiliary component
MSRFLRALAVAGLALSLSACISLLPKSKPATLYRFDGQTAAPAAGGATGAAARPVGILRSGASFTRAAAGDRLLTVNGDQTAYIAEARWASPAVTLFEEAVARAFDAGSGPARLVLRGEQATYDYAMRLDVRNFEAVYDRGPETAPEILVRVRLSLTRAGDRALVEDRTLEARVRAGDNRVSAIVAAFDQGVTEVLTEVVATTNRLPPAAP